MGPGSRRGRRGCGGPGKWFVLKWLVLKLLMLKWLSSKN
jgi:hypothetical protein